MKRLLIWAGLFLLLAITAFYLYVPNLILPMITDYEPYTFEKVLRDPKLQKEYGIANASTPEDFGYQSIEVEFRSLDNTRLSAWYVNNNPESNRCIVISHGRTSNRLKSMKYLALIDSLDLDSAYNVFIPDLRNSGKSAAGKTYMGYKFAEDITASMLFCQKHWQQQQFILYGFSMGAMASMIVSGREDIQKVLNEKDIKIDRLILDSPLINVKLTLQEQIAENPIARPFFKRIYAHLSSEIDEFGENMSISALLPPDLPTLILQSKDDQLTKASIVAREIENLQDGSLVDIIYFEGPGHVKLFQDARTREAYIGAVANFLQSPR